MKVSLNVLLLTSENTFLTFALLGLLKCSSPFSTEPWFWVMSLDFVFVPYEAQQGSVMWCEQQVLVVLLLWLPWGWELSSDRCCEGCSHCVSWSLGKIPEHATFEGEQ